MWEKNKIIWIHFEKKMKVWIFFQDVKVSKNKNKNVNYMLVDQEVNHIRWTNLVRFPQV
jgi:hypothetical protein